METSKFAILSVFNKTKIIELAQFLKTRGYTILSTGGTFRTLADAGIEVVEVSAHTGFPEILDGRVKTLHPRIHGGILARDIPEHVETLKVHGIPMIDVVAVNLYPFEETLAKPGMSKNDIIEMIDIGGPTMLRASAKNFERISVLCDSGDYEEFMLRTQSGTCDLEFRRKLAVKVFARTSEYDSAITSWLNKL